MQKQNTKKIVAAIIAVAVVLGIIFGVNYHNSHILDGTWIEKTSNGEDKTNTATLTKLKIDGKHFSTGNGDYSGDIKRDSKQKKLTFITTKNRNGSDKPTNVATYGLSDDKDELILNFSDGSDDILDGSDVILVKSTSKEGKSIQKQSNQMGEEFKKEQGRADKNTKKAVETLKGKTLVPSRNMNYSSEQLETAAKQDDKEDDKETTIEQVASLAKQGSVKIPQSIQFSKNGKNVIVNYNEYSLGESGLSDTTYNAKIEKKKSSGKVSIDSDTNQITNRPETTVNIDLDGLPLELKYNMVNHTLKSDSTDTGTEITYKIR
ncbi:hypothetical protein [Limosilactobacillus reuteri]|uniref:hypothetical protein n=1 Tax=Limosilactobacillus reuteri TaxID=1598 RepID=UPI001E3B0123|nr:hypothetical protein [Limosilactobacillus reuteri]MCC4482844.1 hypothetical protein [Limosilactobacillus reuteri]